MNLLLTLLIFSIPLGVITRVQVFNNAFLYLNDILASLMFILLIFKLFRKEYKIDNKKILFPFLSFIFVGFIALFLNLSILTPTTFLISLSYLIRYTVYASIIIIVSNLSKKNILGLSKKLIISGLMFVIIGLIQFIYYPSLMNLRYQGWDEHQFRLFSTILDPNFAGILIVFLFILLFVKIFEFYTWSDFKTKTFYIISLIITFIAILLTHSRSALLSLLAGIVTVLIIKKKAKYSIPFFIILVLTQLYFSNYKLEGVNPLRIASAESRISYFYEAVGIFLKHPIFGVGFDAYRYARIAINIGGYGDKVSNAGAGIDNSYMFVLTTTGIVGFLFFLIFLRELIKGVFSKKTKTTKDAMVFNLAASSSLIAILVDSLFINSLFYPLVAVWVFILIGVSLNKKP
jgi:O-antigen ligase